MPNKIDKTKERVTFTFINKRTDIGGFVFPIMVGVHTERNNQNKCYGCFNWFKNLPYGVAIEKGTFQGYYAGLCNKCMKRIPLLSPTLRDSFFKKVEKYLKQVVEENHAERSNSKS